MLELGFFGLLGWCFWKLVPALFIASTLWSLGIGFILLVIGTIFGVISNVREYS